MSAEDRVVARYEQNFVLGDDDPEAEWKTTKRVLRDVFTFGIAEAW